VDVQAGELSLALAELARETGSDILFDERLVRGLRSNAVRDRISVTAALSRMLAGSRVSHRPTADGAYVLFASDAAAGLRSEGGAARRAEGARSEIVTVAEILVTGRRTQNADIARTENDVQPYKVLGVGEIRSALRDDVDELLRSRTHANARNSSPSQGFTVPGDTRSAIDLRGLGTARTLVLVDGRRMPAIPTVDLDLEQADLNGIPLGRIDRIETLTGTAGGIHGPGALGGVVNVILKRDYEGGELRFTHGVTSRGDARTAGVDGTTRLHLERRAHQSDAGRRSAHLRAPACHRPRLLPPPAAYAVLRRTQPAM
jgi:outer membrane receptor protein involved in Fe transport